MHVNSSSGTSSASPFKSSAFSFRFRSSLWRFWRLFMFWSLVLVLKVLFDTYVLVPSVAGVSVDSLCRTPFAGGRNLANPWIASSVPVPALTREELVREAVRVRPNIVGSGAPTESQAHFVQNIACPTLVYSLWAVTGLMSFASTYVSYVVCVAVVGSVVPGFFSGGGGARSRGSRTLAAIALVLFWAAIVLALAVGAFVSCLGLLALLALVHVVASTVGTSGNSSSLGTHSAALQEFRRDIISRGEKKQKEEAQSTTAATAAAPSAAASASSSSSVALVASSSPAAPPPTPPSAALLGLVDVLQILFRARLSPGGGLLVWRGIVCALREEDMVSCSEAAGVLEPSGGPGPGPSPHHSFLDPQRPLKQHQARERLHFFFESLNELARKSSAHRASSSGGDDDEAESLPPRFPFDLSQQKALTTLIPLYTETVFYTLEELLQPSVHPPSSSASSAASSAPAIVEPHISLLEFLVSKHVFEWNNMVERVCGQHPTMADFLLARIAASSSASSSSSTAALPAAFSAAANSSTDLTPLASAALDEFMCPATPSSSASSSSPLRAVLTDELILWCSYRGQTLARTVRGLLYTRRAFELQTRLEVSMPSTCTGGGGGHPVDEPQLRALVHSRYQLLVAAQVYGMRNGGRTNRKHLQQLMRLHELPPLSPSPSPSSSSQSSDKMSAIGSSSSSSSPSPTPLMPTETQPQPQTLEIVYNFDARRDLEECIELRRAFMSGCLRSDGASSGGSGGGGAGSAATLKKLLEQVHEPLGPFQCFEPPQAPPPSGAQDSTVLGPQVLASVAALQARVSACLQQLTSLRMLLREGAGAAGSVAATATAAEAVAAAMAMVASSSASSSKPDAPLASPKLEAMEKASASSAAAAAVPTSASSSSSSSLTATSAAQDEVALHSAMHQVWLELLRFLRYECAALLSSSPSGGGIPDLFRAFLRAFDSEDGGCCGFFAHLDSMDHIQLAAGSAATQHAVFKRTLNEGWQRHIQTCANQEQEKSASIAQIETQAEAHPAAPTASKAKSSHTAPSRRDLLQQTLVSLSAEEQRFVELQQSANMWARHSLMDHLGELERIHGAGGVGGAHNNASRVQAPSASSSSSSSVIAASPHGPAAALFPLSHRVELLQLLSAFHAALLQHADALYAQKQLSLSLSLLRSALSTNSVDELAELAAAISASCSSSLSLDSGCGSGCGSGFGSSGAQNLASSLAAQLAQNVDPALMAATKVLAQTRAALVAWIEAHGHADVDAGAKKKQLQQLQQHASLDDALDSSTEKQSQNDGWLSVIPALRELHQRCLQSAVRSIQTRVLASSSFRFPDQVAPRAAAAAAAAAAGAGGRGDAALDSTPVAVGQSSQHDSSALSSALQDLLHQLTSHHQLQLQAHLAFIAQAFAARFACRTMEQGSGPASAASAPPKPPPQLAALYTSYEQLIVHPFFSVHCCLDSRASSSASSPTASSCVRVLHVLPRHRNLLLGSVPKLVGVGCPQTSAKSENQLHCLPFARGEIVQTIDMNEDFAFEESLKVGWALTEFHADALTDCSRYTLVGAGEAIYTKGVSTVGRLMALQDSSFVTIVQRVLNWTDARLHYGHPDFILAEHAKFSSCGLSKASPEKNLSEGQSSNSKQRVGREGAHGVWPNALSSNSLESCLCRYCLSVFFFPDLFFGTDNRLRGQSASHVEYLRYGKGREVGLGTTAVFEDKLARGASQVLRTPDLFRIAQNLDALSSVAILFGSILHYVYTLIFDYSITVSNTWITLQAQTLLSDPPWLLTHSLVPVTVVALLCLVQSFVWLVIFMSLSDVDAERIGVLGSVYAIPWLFHLGYLFALPLLGEMVRTHGPLWGMANFLDNLLLGSIYYLFQARTKSAGMQSGFHAGNSGYKGTGRRSARTKRTCMREGRARPN